MALNEFELIHRSERPRLVEAAKQRQTCRDEFGSCGAKVEELAASGGIGAASFIAIPPRRPYRDGDCAPRRRATRRRGDGVPVTSTPPPRRRGADAKTPSTRRHIHRRKDQRPRTATRPSRTGAAKQIGCLSIQPAQQERCLWRHACKLVLGAGGGKRPAVEGRRD